jgi:hypothetical protein
MIPIPFIWVLVRFIRTLWLSLKDPEFQALFFLVVVTLASGAVFYRVAEGWSLFDSFYFSVITLTTIGYGDLSLYDGGKDLHHYLHLRRAGYHPGLRQRHSGAFDGGPARNSRPAATFQRSREPSPKRQ